MKRLLVSLLLLFLVLLPISSQEKSGISLTEAEVTELMTEITLSKEELRLAKEELSKSEEIQKRLVAESEEQKRELETLKNTSKEQKKSYEEQLSELRRKGDILNVVYTVTISIAVVALVVAILL